MKKRKGKSQKKATQPFFGGVNSVKPEPDPVRRPLSKQKVRALATKPI